MYNYLWIGIVSLLVGVLVKLAIKLKKEKSKNNELAMHAEDKLREEALDHYILNPNAPTYDRVVSEAKPFAVSYDANSIVKNKSRKSLGKKQGNSKLMVQLVENSELSARKFMLDPSEGINIGKKKGKNDIVITDANVDDIQCNILENNGKIYVRNRGRSGRLVLSRSGKRAFIEKKAIELRNDDLIILESTIFKVEIVKANM